MAEVIRYVWSINLIDGIERSCGNSFYVEQDEALAYLNAADAAARAATPLGILQTRYLLMTDAGHISTNVGIEIVPDPPAALADTILRGNKLKFQVRGGGTKRDFDIPARKVASYSQNPNSLEVSITAPTAMSNFVSQYQGIVVDAYGNVRTIVEAEIVD
jgi:hypothetical protein